MMPAAENPDLSQSTKTCVVTRFPLSRSFSQWLVPILGVLALSACADGVPPSAPLVTGIAVAARTASGLTVKSTKPDTATVDSTLDVHVFGSGFDVGSRAQWALNAVPSAKVVTNSTRFVSSTELVANISIAQDATLASYDVMVTTSSGKGGIGTELFVIAPKTTDLGTLGGTQSEALGMNNLTQVVGWSYVASGVEHAFLWTKEGGMQDLGTLGGTTSRAYAINDNGQVVGSSATAAGQVHAFLWTAATGMQDIGTPGGTRSQAFAINENGDIAGTDMFYGGSENAVVWIGGVLENLGTATSRAMGVNNALQVVGWFAGYAPSDVTALLWTKSGGVWTSEAIPAPISGYSSMAYGINELGQIAGGFRATTGARRAFSWTRAGGSIELPPIPNGKENWAYAIDDAGRIAGWGNDKSNLSNPHPTVWDPTPTGWTARVVPTATRADIWINAVNNNHQAVGEGRKSTLGRATLWDVP
jgi:probable HAF family extracellular repeat protein